MMIKRLFIRLLSLQLNRTLKLFLLSKLFVSTACREPDKSFYFKFSVKDKRKLG